jgi:hypothetical protein
MCPQNISNTGLDANDVQIQLETNELDMLQFQNWFPLFTKDTIKSRVTKTTNK